jgi:hypothetical protein
MWTSKCFAAKCVHNKYILSFITSLEKNNIFHWVLIYDFESKIQRFVKKFLRFDSETEVSYLIIFFP